MNFGKINKKLLLSVLYFFLNNFVLLLLLTSSFTTKTKTLIILADAAFLAFASNIKWKKILSEKSSFSELNYLGNLNNPILSSLAKKAPGTFMHSTNVAQLCSAAGKAIGLNDQYLRLGGYYHDIGKMKNPMLFIENRPEGALIDISKEELAKNLIAHVEDGVKIARKKDLPSEIISVIAQHHGDTRVDSLKKQNFCYPGPKPKSKRAAIVMIADCVEAKSRNEKKLNEEAIEKLVTGEIRKKLDSGQLDDCSLTPAELKKITKAITETLSHIHHKRKYAK